MKKWTTTNNGSVHRRRQLSKETKQLILNRQRNKCFYCGCVFGSSFIKNNKLIFVKPTFDHLSPFSFSYNNKPENFVAACVQCNGIKSSKVFDNTESALTYVRQERKKRNLPMSTVFGDKSEKDSVAKVLFSEVQESAFLEISQSRSDITKLSDYELKQRLKYLAYLKDENNLLTFLKQGQSCPQSGRNITSSKAT